MTDSHGWHLHACPCMFAPCTLYMEADMVPRRCPQFRLRAGTGIDQELQGKRDGRTESLQHDLPGLTSCFAGIVGLTWSIWSSAARRVQ